MEESEPNEAAAKDVRLIELHKTKRGTTTGEEELRKEIEKADVAEWLSFLDERGIRNSGVAELARVLLAFDATHHPSLESCIKMIQEKTIFGTGAPVHFFNYFFPHYYFEFLI